MSGFNPLEVVEYMTKGVELVELYQTYQNNLTNAQNWAEMLSKMVAIVDPNASSNAEYQTLTNVLNVLTSVEAGGNPGVVGTVNVSSNGKPMVLTMTLSEQS